MVRQNDGGDDTVVTDSADDDVAPAGDACLVVFYGKDIGRRYFLRQAEQTIGRSEAANIEIAQESVSRQHAQIVLKEGRHRLQDLGSTNGTFVNDSRVEERDLRDGDFVKVGQTIFKYLSGSNIESKYHEEIYRLTTIDGLTHTYNKRYFFETLERELTRAQRYGRGMSLVMFDIDHFKRTNDTHGHLAGDYVLRQLAAIVAENIRRQDVLARYGGEEFAILLPEIDEAGAVMVCEKLRVLTEQFQFTFDSERIPVTISLGIHALQAGDEKVSVDDFIAQADAKLYHAKQTGRNRVCS